MYPVLFKIILLLQIQPKTRRYLPFLQTKTDVDYKVKHKQVKYLCVCALQCKFHTKLSKDVCESYRINSSVSHFKAIFMTCSSSSSSSTSLEHFCCKCFECFSFENVMFTVQIIVCMCTHCIVLLLLPTAIN